MTRRPFQLTPNDVRAQEFQRIFRGYDPAQVDEFKTRVAEELDRLVRERIKLDERLQGFQEQLRAFRERERAMNEALLAAQQLRVAAQEQAEREAESDRPRGPGRRAPAAWARPGWTSGRCGSGTRSCSAQFAAYLADFRALLERQIGGDRRALQTHAQTIHQVQTELLLKRHA